MSEPARLDSVPPSAVPGYSLRDYDYLLPESLIAQEPCSRRDGSRLLVLDRDGTGVAHHRFEDLPDFLHPGDLLVVNDTLVVPARLRGTKETGGQVELLVLDPFKDPDLGAREGYLCLLKISKYPKAGTTIALRDGTYLAVLGPVQDGTFRIGFPETEPLLDLLARVGEVPLPPYIHRNNPESLPQDATDYQTVYARQPGAVAAPTAGLHFSVPLLRKLDLMGVERVAVTLHVGFGTFSPIRVEDIRRHRMHAEFAEIRPKAAETIEKARREGRRIVGVGTTVVRILEWVHDRFGRIVPFAGYCDHYIYPGYAFHVIDALITNFHLPRSTLLLLVSAFAGRDRILRAYEEAIHASYRFFSYGDAMLIL
ncbi:MAG: tRNA preQ1(34) S-adenosylmethionine ribosyltransferase-isomerase QueA [Syntrophobacteraceae bacterium]|nr:tRNA preQ1(34) S-adenosylmethionine ribosyltransferase-isomerase QueA [Syntrophobacteraceae bacterium]